MLSYAHEAIASAKRQEMKIKIKIMKTFFQSTKKKRIKP